MTIETLQQHHQHALVRLSEDGSLHDRLKARIAMQQEAPPPPTDDELYAEQCRAQDDLFASFFADAFGSVEAAHEALEASGETAEKMTNALHIKEVKELRETTVEENIARQKKTEGEEFQRAKAQERSGATVTEHPKNGEKPQPKPIEDWKNRPSTSPNYGSRPSPYSGSNSSSSSNRPAAASQTQRPQGTPREDGKIPRAIDEFPYMYNAVQRMATQKAPFWRHGAPEEPGDAYIHHAKWHKKLKHKARKFFKSGKGRITLKVGALLLLQFSMGVVGKRYEFENAGQMATMFAMMLGTFFLTRELAEEGIDVTGLGF